MTNLERRALLGDAEAQRECTEKGIVLPCPFCGGKSEFVHLDLEAPFSDRRDVFEVQCRKCGCAPFSLSDYNLFYTEEGMEKAKQLKRKAIAKWNTRPAPPIGRCASCACWDENTCECVAAADIEVAYHRYTEPDFFCGDYKPKGGKENG